MDFLRIKGARIVDESSREVYLRGACVGGWMNMEDFINGYPGTESGVRRALGSVIGEEMSGYFFERMADNFFTESDVRFIASTGANCVRLALGYRHFESDDEPFKYIEKGFERLDRALNWCEKHGVYAILDMHAVAGWQNCHWHSDNNRGASVFWRQKHFQERLAGLWKQFAKRYASRAVVAAYGLMNEPSTGNPDGEHGYDFYENYQSDWPRFNRVCRYLIDAIRSIDKDHIIIVEGDMYSRLFRGMENYGDNILPSNHHYIPPGFGPGAYPGFYSANDADVYWDKQYVYKHLLNQEGWRYAKDNNLPLLVSEFGAQYHGPEAEIPDRLRLMQDQLDVYNESNLHWTTWTYKDMGVMGWVTLNPDCEYQRLIAPTQAMKRTLGCENFVALYQRSMGREKARELADMILDVSKIEGVSRDNNGYAFNYAALTGYAASTVQQVYARLFADVTKEDIQRIMKGFAFENCVPNERYLRVLRGKLKGGKILGERSPCANRADML